MNAISSLVALGATEFAILLLTSRCNRHNREKALPTGGVAMVDVGVLRPFRLRPWPLQQLKQGLVSKAGRINVNFAVFLERAMGIETMSKVWKVLVKKIAPPS